MRGDPVRLTQVVANLLNNAAKYTERGGRIEVGVRREGERVRLTVRDNGIGVAAGELEKIFDLFSQMPSGRERAQGGLGIGLTLVKRLVELHGGTVDARSDGPKLGMEMVVQLPAAADELSEPVRTPAARRGAEGRIPAHPGGRRQRRSREQPGQRARPVGAHGPHRP